LRQSINRSINPINRSINQARNHVIIQSFNHSIDKPAAQHVSNPSVQSIQPSINQPDRLINQSESIVGLWNRRRSFLAISRKVFSKSAHFVRVQKILLEVHKSQAISRKAFAKSAHFVVLQKMLLYLCKITFGRPTKSSISGGLSVQSSSVGSIPTPAMLKVTQRHTTVSAGSAAGRALERESECLTCLSKREILKEFPLLRAHFAKHFL
jgi:hypothetical protein